MAARLRVLVLNERDPLHPKAGGAEIHVAEIAKRLPRHGIDMTQLACAHPGTRAPAVEEIEGMHVRRRGPLPLYYPRVVATTARETRAGAWDVVVECLNKVPFCARAYSAAPVLAVNHHLFGRSAFAQAAWPIAAGVVLIERLIPRVYRDVPFLAISESSRRDLVARGIAEAHIELNSLGIAPPTREPTPVSERPQRIAYLGRLERYKRVDLLVRACAQLARQRPDLELVIVGRGGESARLEALAKELGLGDRTHFTGFVSDTERDTWLAGTRVAVCPSLKEGWGLTVIECNALGVPVVATDAPGLRDAVRAEETGLLVQDGPPEVFVERLAASLGSLLDEPERLAEMASAARAWSRRFDWDASAEHMAEALRKRAAAP